MGSTTLILSVVVGSQLHNLADENSDIDRASVVMTDLKTILSSFVEKIQPKVSIVDEGNSTFYELKHFCKLASQGNPIVLETLWSNKILMTTHLGRVLQANRHRFLNDKQVYAAHRGYLRSQILRIARAEPGELSGEVNDMRRGKLAAAAIRVYHQGIQLLQHGTFSPQVVTDSEVMRRLKQGISQEELVEVVKTELFVLGGQLDLAFEIYGGKRHTDNAWIENYVYTAYAEGARCLSQ